MLAAIREDVHRRRLAAAREWLEWLGPALTAHIQLEERALLPVFDGLEHPVDNGSPAVIRRDHRLIERLLDAIDTDWADPVLRAGHLGRLAGVLEHHDLREARYFKPRLDAHLGPERVREILDSYPPTPGPPELRSTEIASAGAPPSEPLERLAFAVATGDRAAALEALDTLEHRDGTKEARLAEQLRDRLDQDAIVAAWDRFQLLAAARGATGRTPTG